VILDVCQSANRTSQVEDLLRGLKENNPLQELHAALDLFSVTGSYESNDPFATLLATEVPPVPIFNRQPLREHLRDLTKLDATYGAISVDGPTACGKTYSKNLIRHVAAWKGARAVVIEIVNELRALTLRQTLDKITQLLNQPLANVARLLRDQPTDAQAAERFVDWLSGLSTTLAENGSQHWIVFDGLHYDAADPVRKCLIPSLVNSIANGNVLGVKVFLLGYDGTSLGDARYIVLHENAHGVDETQIGDFLKAYAAKQGRLLAPEERAQLLSYVLGGARSPFDHKALQGIHARLQNVIVLLREPNKPVEQLLESLL